jgi:hypothetical protein
MATLSSSSTLEQIQAAYDDNASYFEDGSVPKAKAFVTACRLLLRQTPVATGTREGQLTLRPELIQAEMKSAIEWLQANDTTAGRSGGPRVTSVSFEDFR